MQRAETGKAVDILTLFEIDEKKDEVNGGTEFIAAGAYHMILKNDFYCGEGYYLRVGFESSTDEQYREKRIKWSKFMNSEKENDHLVYSKDQFFKTVRDKSKLFEELLKTKFVRSDKNTQEFLTEKKKMFLSQKGRLFMYQEKIEAASSDLTKYVLDELKTMKMDSQSKKVMQKFFEDIFRDLLGDYIFQCKYVQKFYKENDSKWTTFAFDDRFGNCLVFGKGQSRKIKICDLDLEGLNTMPPPEFIRRVLEKEQAPEILGIASSIMCIVNSTYTVLEGLSTEIHKENFLASISDALHAVLPKKNKEDGFDGVVEACKFLAQFLQLWSLKLGNYKVMDGLGGNVNLYLPEKEMIRFWNQRVPFKFRSSMMPKSSLKLRFVILLLTSRFQCPKCKKSYRWSVDRLWKPLSKELGFQQSVEPNESELKFDFLKKNLIEPKETKFQYTYLYPEIGDDFKLQHKLSISELQFLCLVQNVYQSVLAELDVSNSLNSVSYRQKARLGLDNQSLDTDKEEVDEINPSSPESSWYTNYSEPSHEVVDEPGMPARAQASLSQCLKEIFKNNWDDFRPILKRLELLLKSERSDETLDILKKIHPTFTDLCSEEIRFIKTIDSPVTSVSCGDDDKEKLFLATSNGSWVQTFNLPLDIHDKDEDVRKEEEKCDTTVTSVHVSPDSERLAVVVRDRIKIYNLEYFEFEKKLKVPEVFITDLSWHKNSSTLAACGENGKVYSWELKYEQAIIIKDNTENKTTSLCWDPEGEMLAVGDEKGTVHILIDNKVKGSIKKCDKKLTSICWNPSGTRLAVISGNEKVMVFSVAKDQEKVLLHHTDTINATSNSRKKKITNVRWNPNGNMLAYSVGRKIVIWNHTQHKIEREFSAKTTINCLGWSFDGTVLATNNKKIEEGKKFSGVSLWHTALLSAYPISEADNLKAKKKKIR